MPSLFLSDLHLPSGASPLRETFIRFLESPARAADAVYILGDLFEYWIGDDAGMEIYACEVNSLAALTTAGVSVYFMHGNRDFLVDSAFIRRTGARLLNDPCVIDLYSVPTLLSHGDLYCAGDRAYQRWRRFSRNPAAQWLYHRLPRGLRERIAGGMRAQSAAHKPMQAADIMDVSDAAVCNALQQHRVQRLIHGHTHRPAEHTHDVAGAPYERIVLADWRAERMEYLRVDAAGWRRVLL